MSGLKLFSPPAIEPVSLATVKNHLRVTITDDDDLIGIYMQAARELVETFTGRVLNDCSYVQSLDSFPYYTDTMHSQLSAPPSYYSLPRYSTTMWNYSQMIKLYLSPLRRVDRIDYIASQDGSTQSLVALPEIFLPGAQYWVGDQVIDGNGNLQELTLVTPPAPQSDQEQNATEGSGTPTWATSVNGTVTYNGYTWTCRQVPAPTGNYVIDRISEPGRIFPWPASTNWPSVLYVPNAVKIYHTLGYGTDGKAVPAQAKVAILQLVANWYENREAASSAKLEVIPNHLQNLLWSLRVEEFAPTRG